MTTPRGLSPQQIKRPSGRDRIELNAVWRGAQHVEPIHGPLRHHIPLPHKSDSYSSCRITEGLSGWQEDGLRARTPQQALRIERGTRQRGTQDSKELSA